MTVCEQAILMLRLASAFVGLSDTEHCSGLFAHGCDCRDMAAMASARTLLHHTTAYTRTWTTWTTVTVCLLLLLLVMCLCGKVLAMVSAHTLLQHTTAHTLARAHLIRSQRRLMLLLLLCCCWETVALVGAHMFLQHTAADTGTCKTHTLTAICMLSACRGGEARRDPELCQRSTHMYATDQLLSAWLPY
jgi:hypothetical protein